MAHFVGMQLHKTLNTFAVNTSLINQMQGGRSDNSSGLQEVASNSALLAMHTLHGIHSYG